MPVQLAPHVPRTASNDGVVDAAKKAIGKALIDAKEQVGEVILTVEREAIVDVCRALRDTPGLEYQQLMEIAGVDYPERADRFDVNYCLLSLTKNRRIIVKVATDEATPVPSVTGLWPVAGWLEREVFDMYGVAFSGKGADVVCAPEDQVYGMREFLVRDPDGHVLAFGHDMTGAA